MSSKESIKVWLREPPTVIISESSQPGRWWGSPQPCRCSKAFNRSDAAAGRTDSGCSRCVKKKTVQRTSCRNNKVLMYWKDCRLHVCFIQLTFNCKNHWLSIVFFFFLILMYTWPRLMSVMYCSASPISTQPHQRLNVTDFVRSHSR